MRGMLPQQDELLPFDVKGTWKAMEDCAKQGLTRAIGVSNFSSKKIMDLVEFAEIPPAVNQVKVFFIFWEIMSTKFPRKGN